MGKKGWALLLALVFCAALLSACGIKKDAEDAAEKVGAAVNEVTAEVGQAMDTVTNEVSQAMDTVTNEVGQAVGTVTNEVGQAMDTVTNEVGQAMDTVTNEVTENVGQTMNDIGIEVTDGAGRVMETVVEKVEETVDEATGTVTVAFEATVTGTAAADSGSAVDAAFAARKLTLTEKTIPLPDPDTCTVVVPEGTAREGVVYPSEAEVREALKTEKITLLALSPDGKTYVGYVPQTEKKTAIPLLITGDRVTVIYPSSSRGVPHESLDTYYTRYCYDLPKVKKAPLGIKAGGLTWSPDSRYYYACCLAGGTDSAHFIVDTQTGEMISLDAIEAGFEKDGFLYSGCFSADGQYFYGALFGQKYGGEVFDKIIRYDLNTFEAVKLAETRGNASPYPASFRDGRLLLVAVGTKVDAVPAVVWISPDGTVTEQEYPYNGSLWRARELMYSAESGYGVIWQENKQFRGDIYKSNRIGGPGLYIFRPEDGKADNLDTALFVDNVTEELTAKPVGHLYEEMDPASTQFVPKEFSAYADAFLDVALSPDGRYAAVLLDRRNTEMPELMLMIVRLEDQAYLMAESPEIPGNIINKIKSKAKNTSVMNWTEAGILILGDDAWLWQISE